MRFVAHAVFLAADSGGRHGSSVGPNWPRLVFDNHSRFIDNGNVVVHPQNGRVELIEGVVYWRVRDHSPLIKPEDCRSRRNNAARVQDQRQDEGACPLGGLP